MTTRLNGRQKGLIDNFLKKVNDEQMFLSKATFDAGVRTRHFQKPKVSWKDIPSDTKAAIMKIRNFETLHTDAQLYIDSVQEKDMLIVDRDGGTEFGY